MKKAVTHLSSCHEVMKRILNGQELNEVEKKKIGLRLRKYKMDIRSEYYEYFGNLLEEYLDEVVNFFYFVTFDSKR